MDRKVVGRPLKFEVENFDDEAYILKRNF